MVEVCPRCDAALARVEGEEPAFCWNCGLPQLRVSESVLDAAEARDAAAADAGGGTEVAESGTVSVEAGSLDWVPMLRILLLATAVGLLPCLLLREVLFGGAAGIPVLFLLPLLCLGSGFAYQRSHPQRRMSVGVGAQMGLALGTMLAFAVTTVTAIAGFALRYQKHNYSLQQNFDAMMQQAEAQVRATQPNAPEHLLVAMRSPEWHAGWFLVMQGGIMLLLIVAGMIAGLVAGVLLKTKKQAEEVSD